MYLLITIFLATLFFSKLLHIVVIDTSMVMYCDFVIIVHYVTGYVRCEHVIREGQCDCTWCKLYDFQSVLISSI